MNARASLSAAVRTMTTAAASGSSPTGSSLSCRLLVLGGGAGGCSVAAKFASKLGPGGCVVVEPSDTHYYQPMWTLVGGGLKTVAQSARPMGSVLPGDATWVKDRVSAFQPEKHKVVTANGTEIKYDFLVVALGLDLRYDSIPGLEEALSQPDSGVCSNYSAQYVDRTLKAVHDFKQGNAIFTFPNTPIKCAGAPQKAAYVSDALLRKLGKREGATIKYKTSLPVIFGVKKYADSLWRVCKDRGIDVGLRQELVEVRPAAREAVFRDLERPDNLVTEKYELLHVTPPMSAPAVLRDPGAADLVDQAGYLDVHKETLQHTKYPNIFGIGDCTNLPTSKTAAAVAGQTGVLERNLSAVMDGQLPSDTYDGYTSCPLVTSLDKCILAEFDYNLKPLETFPWDQGVERWTSFFMKKEIMPLIYWHGLLKGRWNGPKFFRKILSLGMK